MRYMRTRAVADRRPGFNNQSAYGLLSNNGGRHGVQKPWTGFARQILA
jgi:hypothetical protein